jgi:DNA repair protein RecO (recombination protein O)
VSSSQRIQNEPAWLLHHRPFRDTSRILDILSRDHGRLSLVARGSRSAKSRLKGILRPFLPLQLSWVIRADMGTLTGAEMDGMPISLAGDALMSGYYVNELLIRLMHRHDPQPEVYSVYQATISELNGATDVAATLRRFEMALLGLLGYALNLDHDMRTGEEFSPDCLYEYRPEQGPVAVDARRGPLTFSGSELVAIARQDFADDKTLKAAGRLLRQVITWHLDGKELLSRKVLREMRRAADNKAEPAKVNCP